MVAAIGQSNLLLSIPQMWNLVRKGWVFEPESILIIISCGLVDIEKREAGLQVVCTSIYQMFQKVDGGQFALL